jgi:broad-specificity NMP kinase
MEAVDFGAYAKYKDEIKELKRVIDALKKSNSELEQKVQDIYGAYETLQYTTRGRLMSCSTEIVRLRQENEALKNELRARGWEEQ